MGFFYSFMVCKEKCDILFQILLYMCNKLLNWTNYKHISISQLDQGSRTIEKFLKIINHRTIKVLKFGRQRIIKLREAKVSIEIQICFLRFNLSLSSIKKFVIIIYCGWLDPLGWFWSTFTWFKLSTFSELELLSELSEFSL